ncbi:MAG TPA: hypothetical protein VMB79_12955 [Jatrophihabitans sp.]|nr:hypothetical protein [Jatrophihabitans sp.]
MPSLLRRGGRLLSLVAALAALGAAPAGAAAFVAHGHTCNAGAHGTVCGEVRSAGTVVQGRSGVLAGPGTAICDVHTVLAYQDVVTRATNLLTIVVQQPGQCVRAGRAEFVTPSYDLRSLHGAFSCQRDRVFSVTRYTVNRYPGRTFAVQSQPVKAC